MTDEPRVSVDGIWQTDPALAKDQGLALASQQEVSPVIENPNDDVDPAQQIEFRGDDRVAFGYLRKGPLIWAADYRPVEDLVKLGQLYSERRLGRRRRRAAPPGREELQALVERAASEVPGRFSIFSTSEVEWRIRQLRSASETQQRAAVAISRRWLAAALAESGWRPGERGNESLTRTITCSGYGPSHRYGRNADVFAAALALAARWSDHPQTLFGCARVHALAAGAVKTMPVLPTDTRLCPQRAAAGGSIGLQGRRTPPQRPGLRCTAAAKDFLQLARPGRAS